MKKGFTILEMLVASLLLGMLFSILTMMFNQSSIAWRTGVAGSNALEEVRENMAEVRDEADNVYLWKGEKCRIVGLWNSSGNLRNRAWTGGGSASDVSPVSKVEVSQDGRPADFKDVGVGTATSTGAKRTYTVNVKSAGPDREFDTWDDIWSYPDEIN